MWIFQLVTPYTGQTPSLKFLVYRGTDTKKIRLLSGLTEKSRKGYNVADTKQIAF